LLGKKSWNVYNQDNIERVKRDEATAKAIEEAEEQRMQEVDAERRIQMLRGEIPAPLQIEDKPYDGRPESLSHGSGRERKRRKKAGENDTDFEMRIAHDQALASKRDKQIMLRKPIDAPLVDHSGHIDLFPQERSTKSVEKNAEAEKEAARKTKEYEDQYTMRFSNAAGFKQGLENPWYSKSAGAKDIVEEDAPGRDVWGNEDPRRKEREAARIVSSDPLAMMRQGAAQVRQVEKERKRWREEKEKELHDLVEAEERRKKHKRRYDEVDDEDDLEDFELNQSGHHSSRRHGKDRERRHGQKHKESRRISHRDQEESSRHRHRDRSRHQN
jgi:hypothetical protein